MDQENPSIMIRKSIHTFLKRYEHFTSTSTFLALPFSASLLISQAILPYSFLLLRIHTKLWSLLDVATFPTSSQFFSFLVIILSQTMASSIITLPFTVTSLLLAKAHVIKIVNQTHTSNSSSISSIYKPLLHTYTCNIIFIISTNAATFFILSFVFNVLEGFGFSSYSLGYIFLSTLGGMVLFIVLVKSLILSNFALVVSGTEKRGWIISIVKASELIRGRISTALFLTIPVNIAMHAVGGLFKYRVVMPYNLSKRLSYSIASEGFLIAYLYAILIVLDTTVNCMFYKCCKMEYREDQDNSFAMLKSLEEGH